MFAPLRAIISRELRELDELTSSGGCPDYKPPAGRGSGKCPVEISLNRLAEICTGGTNLGRTPGRRPIRLFSPYALWHGEIGHRLMDSGFDYDRVRKVISINIVYFDLGHGKDYVRVLKSVLEKKWSRP